MPQHLRQFTPLMGGECCKIFIDDGWLCGSWKACVRRPAARLLERLYDAIRLPFLELNLRPDLEEPVQTLSRARRQLEQVPELLVGKRRAHDPLNLSAQALQAGGQQHGHRPAAGRCGRRIVNSRLPSTPQATR